MVEGYFNVNENVQYLLKQQSRSTAVTYFSYQTKKKWGKERHPN